jgi:hypothetical protein
MDGGMLSMTSEGKSGLVRGLNSARGLCNMFYDVAWLKWVSGRFYG